jgi:hypothetical protein
MPYDEASEHEELQIGDWQLVFYVCSSRWVICSSVDSVARYLVGALGVLAGSIPSFFCSDAHS